MSENLVSVPELLKTILDNDDQIPTSASGGVTVGPATGSQQASGCIVLAESGMPLIEKDVALIRMAITARCIAATVDRAERISAVLIDAVHRQGRQVIEQASTSQSFLVHSTMITGGPTLAVGEISDTWEHVLTIEVLVGTEPVV